MREDLTYEENLTSNRTTGLFLGLSLLFLFLFLWRVTATGLNGWAIVFALFSLMFMFYTINYRVLNIQITSTELLLRFGLFTWRIFLENIVSCKIDEISAVYKIRWRRDPLHDCS